MAPEKKYKRLGLMAAVGTAGILLGLSGGSALATTITATAFGPADGNYATTINFTGHTIAGGGSSVNTYAEMDQVTLQQPDPLGVAFLNTYCVDIFHYTTAPSTYNVGTAGSAGFDSVTSQTGTTAWTSQQLNLLNALLYNGSLQTQNAINTASLQIAIWEVEYAPILSDTYTSSLLTSSSQTFYFSNTDAAVISQAVADLNSATGGSPAWSPNPSDSVGELSFSSFTSSTSQSLIYLITPSPGGSVPSPEPSTLAILGAGIAGLFAARRPKQA